MFWSAALRSLQTKYFPARITYVRFHSLPAILNTSCAVARRLQRGQSSTSTICIACAFFFFVTEIWSVCELLTKPKTSKIVFQFERFLALGWVSRPAFPAQKVVRNPMQARPTRLQLIFSSSDCWALMRSWSSTCTTVWKRLDSFSPLLARIFASGGTGVGSPTSQRSPYLNVFYHLYPFRQHLYVTEIGITVGVFCR